MKILESQSATLSNYEVLQHVKAQQADYAGKDGKDAQARRMPKNLEIVLKDVHTNLTAQSAPLNPKAANTIDDASFQRAFTMLGERFEGQNRLTKAEFLHVVNLCPKTMEELYALIEEPDERFDDEEKEAILAIVRECFLGGDGGENGAGDGMQEDG